MRLLKVHYKRINGAHALTSSYAHFCSGNTYYSRAATCRRSARFQLGVHYPLWLGWFAITRFFTLFPFVFSSVWCSFLAFLYRFRVWFRARSVGHARACRCSRGFSHTFKSATSLLSVNPRSLVVRLRFGHSKHLTKKGAILLGVVSYIESHDIKRWRTINTGPRT